MPVVGTLTVDLVANTATFTADLGKAGNSVEGFGKQAEEAGGKVDYSMMEARHGVMMLGEEFGIHLPRGLTTFIASLGPVGVAMEAAFPFLAIALGATLLIEKLTKLHEKAGELGEAQAKSANTTNDIFSKLGDKMLEVGIRTDELAGNHLAALRKQLQLIDRQTMSGVIEEFDKMGKSADDVFVKMQSNWFMQLLMGRADVGPAKAELQSMVAEIDKLKGTGVDPGNATRALLGTDIDQVSGKISAIQAQMKGYSAQNAADRKAGVMDANDANDRRIHAAQQELDLEKQNLATLQQMKDVASQSVAIGSAEKNNDTTGDANREATAQQAGLEKREAVERRYYTEHERLVKEAAKKDLEAAENLASEERAATNAVNTDAAKQLQEKNKAAQSGYDEDLRAAIENAKTTEQLAREAASDKVSIIGDASKARLAAEITATKAEVSAEVAAYQQRLDALATFAEKYTEKKKELEDKIAATQKKGTAETAKEQATSDKQMLADVQRGYSQMANDIAGSIAKSIVMHKSLAESARSMGEQMLENVIKHALMMKLPTAQAAARAAFKNATEEGAPMPVPQIEAAAAFAQVMAFADGGLVPGSGSGDTVPAMLSPGETVVSKALTDSVRNNTTNNRGGDVHVHTQINAVDAAGFEGLLHKHANIVSKHVRGELRKANKR